MTTMSNIFVYSSARRASNAVLIGWPSSVTATQPASFQLAEFRHLLATLAGRRGGNRVRRARQVGVGRLLGTYWVTPALSFTGDVLGMQATGRRESHQ